MERTGLDRIFKSSILVALLVLVIYLAGNIIFPVMLSVFIVLALKDVMNWFDSKKVPVTISALLVTVGLSVVFLGVIWLLVIEGYQLTTDIQGVSGSATLDSLEHLLNLAQEKFNLTEENVESPIKSAASTIFSFSGQVLSAVFYGLQSALVFLSLIPLYVFFMLTFRKQANKFLKLQFDVVREQHFRKMIDDVSMMLRRYLGGLFIVISIVGTLNSIGLSVIGLKHAVFLGYATALLMIIPYIGVIVGSIIPAVLALITLDSPWYALIVLGMYVVIQFAEGNYITPKIVGGSVNLNPLSIIIGMVILGMIGGTLALVLAVPIIATIRILLASSKLYKHYAVLLGND